MSGYLFSDLPRLADTGDYTIAIRAVQDQLSVYNGLVSLYAIGGVSAPGISDLDMVAVFQNNSIVAADPRKGLDDLSRYLFIHALYGASAEQFLQAQSFSFFRPYRLLHGEDLLAAKYVGNPAPEVRDQVALEYLLKFYISLAMQRTYRLLRVRSVLLNAKGAGIDLLHVAPESSTVQSFISEVTELRSRWFSRPNPPLNDFQDWFDRFCNWFFPFMTELFEKQVYYVPESRDYRMSKHLTLSPADRLSYTSTGLRLPFLYPLIGRKYFNLLNRMNRIHFNVPSSSKSIPPAVMDYFEFNSLHRSYNRLHLPGYLPLTSSLHMR